MILGEIVVLGELVGLNEGCKLGIVVGFVDGMFVGLSRRIDSSAFTPSNLELPCVMLLNSILICAVFVPKIACNDLHSFILQF